MCKDAKYFELVDMTGRFTIPTKDVGNYCFGTTMSTIFMPLQFALFCGFKIIYLVGCDCIGSNFVYTDHKQIKNDKLINTWKLIKDWINFTYPNVEVKVINPLELKDIFPEYKQNINV